LWKPLNDQKEKQEQRLARGSKLVDTVGNRRND
jgi:hypothetical protein